MMEVDVLPPVLGSDTDSGNILSNWKPASAQSTASAAARSTTSTIPRTKAVPATPLPAHEDQAEPSISGITQDVNEGSDGRRRSKRKSQAQARSTQLDDSAPESSVPNPPIASQPSKSKPHSKPSRSKPGAPDGEASAPKPKRSSDGKSSKSKSAQPEAPEDDMELEPDPVVEAPRPKPNAHKAKPSNSEDVPADAGDAELEQEPEVATKASKPPPKPRKVVPSNAEASDAAGGDAKPSKSKRAAASTKPSKSARSKPELPRDEPSKPKAKAGKSKPTPVEDADMLEQGFVSSGNEDGEREAALSSPVKGGTARRSTKALVRIEDLDVMTPNPVRMKTTKTEPRDDDETPVAAKSKGKGKANAGKGKRRVEDSATEDSDNSDAMVVDAPVSKPSSTVTNSSSSTSKSGSRKPKWTTADLPAGAQDDERWSSVFVPTLLKYQGSRHDPWAWDPVSSAAVIQKIWDKVFDGKVVHKVAIGDNVYQVAKQRIYEWRSAIGSSAITVFESCFAASSATRYDEKLKGNTKEIEAARAKFCSQILPNYQFVWKDPTGSTPKKGLFHSPFILPLLATHLDQTAQALNMPELYDPDHPVRPTFPHRPVGAIGLICAAVERVIHLWVDGRITLNLKGKPLIPLQRNQATGKMSGEATHFSANNFLSKTVSFVKSASTITDKQMLKLLTAAAAHASGPPPATEDDSQKHSIGRDELFEVEEDDDVCEQPKPVQHKLQKATRKSASGPGPSAVNLVDLVNAAEPNGSDMDEDGPDDARRGGGADDGSDDDGSDDDGSDDGKSMHSENSKDNSSTGSTDEAPRRKGKGNGNNGNNGNSGNDSDDGSNGHDGDEGDHQDEDAEGDDGDEGDDEEDSDGGDDGNGGTDGDDDDDSSDDTPSKSEGAGSESSDRDDELTGEPASDAE
ncbi:hypothetical protein OH77DRAFT_813930 [Trametes cingulata]|nr:hypothetical protein OH77DRAFT_813930 [Trametes cingulata]